MAPMLRILVTGKTGQLGHALVPALTACGDVVAVGHDECDLTDERAIARTVRTIRPDIIVNAAAYTAVDKAESDRANAFVVNAQAPGILADLANESGAVLIHYSTDYVFDGRKPEPYCENDETAPLSVYGASKRAGEVAVQTKILEHVILRTSWVFSTHGNNFLKTMLRLACEREELNVVSDQIGAPTSAQLLARGTVAVVQRILRDKRKVTYGTYHFTAKGATSWHGYASFVISEAQRLGMPVRVTQDAIKPIPARAYPTSAIRPANSQLDTGKFRSEFAFDLAPWQEGILEVLAEL